MSNFLWNTVKPPRHGVNVFDLSHEVKTTTDFGRITPIACEEVLPGDSFRVSSEVFSRVSPLITPVMQNMDIYVHWFFVPNRIIWRGWEDFITQSYNGQVGNKPPVNNFPTQLPLGYIPKSALSTTEYGFMLGNSSLADYLGLQITSTDGSTKHPSQWTHDLFFNLLPFVAYHRIWYDYYRDENIDSDVDFYSEELTQMFEGGAPCLSYPGLAYNFNQIEDPSFITAPRYRSYRKDYYTSALPFVQKGADVTLPLSGNLPVSLEDLPLQFRTGPSGAIGSNPVNVQWSPNSSSMPQSAALGVAYSAGETSYTNLIANLSSVQGSVNLADGVSVTINELRRANALQKWEEANARGGTRYVEQILSHFGVVGDDARMQRAEYLGGGHIPVNISEVLQTSESTSNSPLGSFAGRGIAAGSNFGFTSRVFKEHGFIMGLLTIMPKASYMQGSRRFFGKRNFADFGWPLLGNLGEQPIYEHELYNNGIPQDPETTSTVFGYTPRYAEYKFSPDKTCGDFRNGLSDFHLARIFRNVPRLNSQFLQVLPSNNNRIFAVADGDHFWLQIYHHIKVKRHLPRYGTPSL